MASKKTRTFSVVITTKDRPTDLLELLDTILLQTSPPLEVIVVDNSPEGSSSTIVLNRKAKFALLGCRLLYLKGINQDLTAARNMGVSISRGDAIFFLDDDVLLEPDALSASALFLARFPNSLGFSPTITLQHAIGGSVTGKSFANAAHKSLMLSYEKDDTLQVRRSGTSVLPRNLTHVITAERLSGVGCYMRQVFTEFQFDTLLKRYSFMEDEDFSYRVHSKHPGGLYATPSIRVVHKKSPQTRLPDRDDAYMQIVYWFYVFFKDVSPSSSVNLFSFLWALNGNMLMTTLSALPLRKRHSSALTLVHLIGAYFLSFRNLKSILRGHLEFFNSRFG
jgi:glycosyltransferase involved in cell wall biosynthesis